MKSIIFSIKAFLLFTVLTGVIYPLFVTGLAQALFHEKANGSLIKTDDRIIGSKLIGQEFDSVVYFSSRPSAINYNPNPSGGSNYSLTNTRIKDLYHNRRSQFISANEVDSITTVPSEMLFTSASGLDPHISPEAAYLQVDRIAQTRNFSADRKQELVNLIKDQTEKPQFLFLGRERVNVLILNLKTDNIK